jgi:tetratricopeptide (TPR) repeat protein
LVDKGERMRETGDPEGAIPIFERARNIATQDVLLSEITRHIGLCYEHLDDYEEAIAHYALALEFANGADDDASRARCIRHISSAELKLGNCVRAVELAKEAYGFASRAWSMNDRVWVAHGVVKAMIETRRAGLPISISDIRDWERTEWNDLKEMWKEEENPIRRKVWLTGWMLDAAYAYGPWSWALVPVAFVISKAGGLKLRQRQILTGKR